MNNIYKHWEYVYHHRRGKRTSDATQIIAGQTFTIVVSMVAGIALESVKHTLIVIVGLLFLMPGVVDLCASIAGALGAKVNHLIEITPKKVGSIVMRSVIFSLVLCFCAGLILSLIGSIAAVIFFNAIFLQVFIIGITSMMITGIICFPLVAILTVIAKRRGYDPDNIIGPIQSSLVDIVAVLALFLLARLFI